MKKQFKLTENQQAVAIDRAGESLALQSGAGCGKTFVLARRFTELLLKHGRDENPLSHFVALTLTDKAMMEMNERVRKMLLERASAAQSTKDRQKLISWLEQLPEAKISTIHSFCASLLRSHAIEAGLDPDFAVCSDTLLTDKLTYESAESALLGAIEESREDAAELLNTLSYNAAISLIRKLLDLRADYVLKAHTQADVIIKRWQQQLDSERKQAHKRLIKDSALIDELESLGSISCSDPTDKLAIFLEDKLEIIRQILVGKSDLSAEDFQLLLEKPGRKGSAGNWGDKETAIQVRERIKALCAAVSEYAPFFDELNELDDASAQAIATLAKLALEANEIYTSQKRQLGILDFTDLLYYARELLTINSQVRNKVNNQIDQLLIDECQDTSSSQVALLLLALFGEDNFKDSPQSKLFLVGDAKQSIYRFRGAQVEVFEDLCNVLGENRQKELDVSFRTHKAGIGFINELFTPLIGKDYSPIEHFRPEIPQQPSVEILLADTDEDNPILNADMAVELQARLTSQRIAEMLEKKQKLVWDDKSQSWRPVQPRDITILFNRMTKSLPYEKELARRSIPFYVIAGTGFFNQQEVFDVINALKVIDNPFDDIAFFGVLRSSMVGLDDNCLMQIAKHLQTPYLPKLKEKMNLSCLDEPCRQILFKTVELLTELHNLKDAVGIDVLIERILDATGYEATLLSQFQGKQMLGNVRRIIQLARDGSISGISLADFLNQMNERIIDQSRFEQAAVVGEEENVVRLMTVHKAKGLEFPVVILPDLNFNRRGTSGPLLSRKDWRLNLKLESDDEEESNAADLPMSYRIARLKEKNDQHEEDIRKLYVAATRHKDHLVFIGANWRTKDGKFEKGDCYLNLLDEVLDISGTIDSEKDSIEYCSGQFKAAIRNIVPSRPKSFSKEKRPGEDKLILAKSGEELAEDIITSIKEDELPTLIGPLTEKIGCVELAVTALSDFERCPMLYRWRHELCVPSIVDNSVTPTGQAPAALDAATMGTIYHRCMELLDLSNTPDATQLVKQALSELSLQDTANTTAIANELTEMLGKFLSHDLSSELSRARQDLRELDFILDLGPAKLRGQIDLLFQDDSDQWHIVDYKSDRISNDAIASHSANYELQMLIYASAAARITGKLPLDAKLYFLRLGKTYDIKISPESLEALEGRAKSLACELSTARRSNVFARCDSKTFQYCQYCQYKGLCGAT